MAEIPKELFKQIRRIEIATNRLAEDLLVGMYHSAFKGKGMEFEEVRAYVEGDDVRNIDWNVTARTHEPHIKNFREERELTVLLVVDVSASSYFGTKKKSKREWIAEIGGLLAFTAIKNNDKVGLLLFSDQVEKYLPPRKGLRHVLRVIRELLAFPPKSNGSDIKKALSFLGNVQKRRSVCFLLSDFLFPLEGEELAVTSRRHDLIALHILDPVEKAFPSIGLVNLKDLETGAMRYIDTADETLRKKAAEKFEDNLLAVKETMGRIGAGHVLINTSASYIEPLRKFFKLRKIRH